MGLLQEKTCGWGEKNALVVYRMKRSEYLDDENKGGCDEFDKVHSVRS